MTRKSFCLYCEKTYLVPDDIDIKDWKCQVCEARKAWETEKVDTIRFKTSDTTEGEYLALLNRCEALQADNARLRAELEAYHNQPGTVYTSDDKDDDYTGGDTFIKIDGKTFRCPDCGANVFSKHATDPMRYRCNGCEMLWQGEGLTAIPDAAHDA